MIQFLKRQNKPDLAYEALKGSNDVTVMFLGGFRSDMMGTKAEFLKEQCQKLNLSYVRFDYRGHGQSEGKFEEACISAWVEDAYDILQETVEDQKVMLIGSSMGGWISLLLALKLPEQLRGLIGLAAAPDFTKWMEEGMTDEQRDQLKIKGYFDLPNDYDEPYVITQKLLDDGRQNSLLDGDIDIQCPVRLVQGMKDDAVEWQTAHRIKNAVTGDDVEVILLEEADHRLSSPDELEVLLAAVKALSV